MTKAYLECYYKVTTYGCRPSYVARKTCEVTKHETRLASSHFFEANIYLSSAYICRDN